MADDIREIPVYLLTGFLDSGKTTFLNGVLGDGFGGEGTTLVICCEEGEEEYELDETMEGIHVVMVEDEEELTHDFLRECEEKYNPDAVLIEFNGMWMLAPFIQEVLPDNWLLYQTITLVEASTFDVYAKNMGQMMMEKLMLADMIVFNRCTEELKASLRARNLRMVNRRAEIFLEEEDGSAENYLTGDECPFDLEQEIIDIPDDDFGVWYVDVMDKPERYAGKKVHLKTVMFHSDKYPGVDCLGRFAMVCCANDISFLALVGKGAGLDAYADRDWMEIVAEVTLEKAKPYKNKKGPVLNVLSSAPCEQAAQEVITF